MADSKLIYGVIGAGLMGAWFLTRGCCSYPVLLAIDRPLRDVEDENQQRRHQPPSSSSGCGYRPASHPYHPSGGIPQHHPTAAAPSSKVINWLDFLGPLRYYKHFSLFISSI